MKALSVRQPFAWAIVHGGKDVENRSWATSYRGPVLIHAGMRWHDVTPAMLAHRMGVQVPAITRGPRPIFDVLAAVDDGPRERLPDRQRLHRSLPPVT